MTYVSSSYVTSTELHVQGLTYRAVSILDAILSYVEPCLLYHMHRARVFKEHHKMLRSNNLYGYMKRVQSALVLYLYDILVFQATFYCRSSVCFVEPMCMFSSNTASTTVEYKYGHTDNWWLYEHMMLYTDKLYIYSVSCKYPYMYE